MIPNIIHQIWIQGYDQIPPKLKNYHKTCQSINNDFRHMFWTEDQIQELLLNSFGLDYVDLYNYYKVPAQKADFARYAILYVWGGIYLDMDIVCRKNLKPFLRYKLFFTRNKISFSMYQRYPTTIIGAVKHHPMFAVLFENIFSRRNQSHKIIYSTGPKLFYDSVKKYVQMTNDNDVMVIDPKYMHPCEIADSDSCPHICQDCYVAHISHLSWSMKLRVLKFILKNITVLSLTFILALIILIIILFWKKNSGTWE